MVPSKIGKCMSGNFIAIGHDVPDDPTLVGVAGGDDCVLSMSSVNSVSRTSKMISKHEFFSSSSNSNFSWTTLNLLHISSTVLWYDIKRASFC
jgi:hypothetical protein